MDEEVTIIDSNTRNEKIKNFFINNKKNFIITISTIIIIIIGYFSFDEYKQRNKTKLVNQFNNTIIDFKINKKNQTIKNLISIIKKQDNTYSPLALYFLIDNDLIDNKNKINELFDVLIEKTNLEKEIKNLIIYKKGLYNSDLVNENELIQLLNPIINSESIWKSHALYLVAEYFFSKGEEQKSKEFFNQILSMPNSNKDIQSEALKRINRDLSE